MVLDCQMSRSGKALMITVSAMVKTDTKIEIEWKK